MISHIVFASSTLFFRFCGDLRFAAMLSVFASLVLSDVWPNMGIHDGDNKVVWTVGCCDGDLITRSPTHSG